MDVATLAGALGLEDEVEEVLGPNNMLRHSTARRMFAVVGKASHQVLADDDIDKRSVIDACRVAKAMAVAGMTMIDVAAEMAEKLEKLESENNNLRVSLEALSE